MLLAFVGKNFDLTLRIHNLKHSFMKENLPKEETSEEIYYNYDDNDLDDSGINFAQAANYIDEEETEEKDSHSQVYPSAFLLLLNIMFSPVEGWKKLRRSKIPTEKIQAGCFYPILAVLAAANFMELFYSSRTSISEIVVKGVVAFTSYFFGYFCVLLVLQLVLTKTMFENFKEEYGKNFIMMALASLAFFQIFSEILPILWPVLIFLPLWTIFFMVKGIKFFHLSQQGSGRFTFFVCLTVILVPFLLQEGIGFILKF